MTQEVTNVADPQEEAVTQEEPQIDIEAILKENEILKKEKSGQDKKNTELSSQLKELDAKIKEIETAELSKEELWQREQEEQKKMFEEQAKELNQRQKKLDRLQAIADSKLDPELGEFLTGNSYEDFMKSAQKLMGKFSTSVQTKVKQQLGSVDANGLQAGGSMTKAQQYEQALNSGDITTALNLAKIK